MLKDPETLESYKIKSGHTVHLVKGAASSSAAGAASSSAAAAAPTATGAAANTPSSFSTGTGSFNPLADLTGARYAGYGAQLPDMSMFGPDGGMGAMPNEDELENMMSNPMFQQSMNELLRNPQMMDYLIEQSPQLRGMGPQVRQMMQSEQFRAMLTNPQMMRQMRDMQRMFGGAGAAGPAASSFPVPGENPNVQSPADSTGAATPASASTASTTATPPVNPFASLMGAGAAPGAANPFASLLGGAGAAGLDPALLQSLLGAPASTPAQPEDNRPPEERYESQLRQLNDMGFSDFERNVRALRRSGGSVQGAVENLLSE